MTEKKMAVVTATANPIQSAECRASWNTRDGLGQYVVENGSKYHSELPDQWTEMPLGLWVYSSPQFLGVVPAFAIGVQKALDDGYEIIACLHDDLLIEDPTWVDQVRHIFKVCPHAGLVGFGGAVGLGDPLIYQKPYDPMQLARRGFLSNMRDAEAHGQRTEAAQRVAVLDGFSQIGLARFWAQAPAKSWGGTVLPSTQNLFQVMQSWGLVHHAYDAALGCLAKRLGYQVWLAPVACRHFGGRTAVGSGAYQEWARTQIEGGDQGFWLRSHQIVWNEFRRELPIN